MTSTPVVVSAPGKVLLAGGYLVLSPTYPGLVIATDSRFYSVVSARPTAVQGQQLGTISIRSPQFQGALWEYRPIRRDDGNWDLVQTKASRESETAGANPFISLAVLYTLRLVSELRGSEHLADALKHGTDVAVLADNDFYSQRQGDKPPSASYLRSLPPFNAKPIPIREVHKTGLGSSAAMTTSLVGSLMAHLGALSSFTSTQSTLSPRDLALVHNLAQLAHCAAQGKVGSGFDVSSATWGSHLFRRFDPEVIRELLDGEKVEVEGSEPSTSERRALSPYLDPANPLWFPSPLSASEGGSTFPTAVEGLHATRTAPSAGDDEETPSIAQPPPLSLPPFIKMVLADVDAGSNTPSLVGKVMQWKKEKPEWANQLFSILATSVQALADAFLTLSLAYQTDAKAYEDVFEAAAARLSKDWDTLPESSTLSALIEARQALRSIRAGMRELGQRSGAPVEPDEMGRVIRACIDGAEGVLGGGVPGAGGFDALYILYLSPPSVSPSSSSASQEASQSTEEDAIRDKIESIWSAWTELSVGPLLSSAGEAQSSGSTTDKDGEGKDEGKTGGLRIQDVEDVPGLSQALQRGQA